MADHGRFAVKPFSQLTTVTSWEVPFDQPLKVGKPELHSWMSRPAIFGESEDLLLSHVVPIQGWF